MPVVLTTNGTHTLSINKTKTPVRADTVEFELTGDSGVVTLDGPKYNGYVSVSRGACKPGAPIELVARAKKAVLKFTGNPPKTTVRCVAGPCPDNLPHLLDTEVVKIDLGAEHEAEISLEVRAQGYKSTTLKRRIVPGDNSIQIGLTPL